MSIGACTMKSLITTKMLGDAGEHYALSQFSFAGKPASKMPDGWKGYDLAVETGEYLARVSVKTRSETDAWAANRWFTFDVNQDCHFLVLIFKPQKKKDIRAWVIPFSVAKEHASQPGPRRKEPHIRDLSWSKLVKDPLSRYEDNWDLTV